MKSLLLFIFIFYLTSCNETVKPNHKVVDSHNYKKTYYSSGQLKELISLNSESIKEGLTTFYDSTGRIDSTENYLDGKLNGIKTFYGLDRKIEYHFENDTLYSLHLFDTLENLKYQSPINTSLLEKPFFKLKSGNNYLVENKVDTIEIITKGIPYYNRLIGFYGATYKRISDSSYIVFLNKLVKRNRLVKITIAYINDLEDKSEKPIIYDSILIPIK
ncbi:MAG: hypothetical protein JSR97_07755 [Verrucomicrobia bacterium]|nr:hypothetical protein [Verrucomicrobiota bacterium]